MAYDLSKLGILMADDNPHMRVLLRRILASLGVRNIKEADGGAAMLAMLKSFQADLVFVDWLMPEVDGMSAVRTIRTGDDSPNPYVPIVMMSGHIGLDELLEARDAGVNEFLAKPLAPRVVYDRIIKVIEKPRPFIKTTSYFGPCRRRRQSKEYAGPERRGSGEAAAA